MIEQPVSNRKKKIWVLFAFFSIIILGGVVYVSSLLRIMTGYAAKNMCSAVFIAGRAPEEFEPVDLNFFPVSYTKNKVNYNDSTVTSRFLWGRSKAIDLEEFGSVLLRKSSEKTLRGKRFPDVPGPGYLQDTIPWPMGNLIPDTITGANLEALKAISGNLINKNEYGGNGFAFMVLHKGIPVAEAYKPQFDADSRFLSWSMAKSVTNALIGVLVKDNVLNINDPADIQEWKKDERRNITINDIMQMQSGLKWNEDYGNLSDITVMLHNKGDMARYAYDQPLEYSPGSHFEYSSGMANVLTYLIRDQFNNDSIYYSFPYTKLFHRIGITDAVFETDPSGTFVGSSYLYATLRDYARFALLYQQDGVFGGERVLPEGWVDYTRKPASASEGEYGSLFWLNGKGKVPSAPKDTYMCIGHDGQRIFIVPSREAIVVVLGYSPKDSMNFDRLLADVLNAL